MYIHIYVAFMLQNGSQEFNNARAAMASPLANKLFGIDGVTAVFFGSDFITVTKKDEVSWAVLKPDIFASVMDHFASGEPIVHSTEALSSSDTAIHEDDDEVTSVLTTCHVPYPVTALSDSLILQCLSTL